MKRPTIHLLFDDQSPLLEVSGNSQKNAVASNHAGGSVHKSRTYSTAASSIKRLQAEAERKLLELKLQLKKLQIEEETKKYPLSKKFKKKS